MSVNSTVKSQRATFDLATLASSPQAVEVLVPSDLQCCGGAGGNRTRDPLLAKQCRSRPATAETVRWSPARQAEFGTFALVSRVSSVQMVLASPCDLGQGCLGWLTVVSGLLAMFVARFFALGSSGVGASQVRDRDEIHIPGRVGVRIVRTDIGFTGNLECDFADLVLGLTREIRNRDARSLPRFIADLGDEGSRHAPRPLARRFAFDPCVERGNVSKRHYSDGGYV